MPMGGASGMSHNSSRMHSSIYGSAIAARPAASSRPASRGGVNNTGAGGGGGFGRGVTSNRTAAADRIMHNGLTSQLREGSNAVSAFADALPAGPAAGRANPRTALDLGSVLGGSVPPADWRPTASALAGPEPAAPAGPFDPLTKQSYMSFCVTNATDAGEPPHAAHAARAQAPSAAALPAAPSAAAAAANAAANARLAGAAPGGGPLLGKGVFANVRMTHGRDGQVVAVKTYDHKAAQGEKAVARHMANEVTLAARGLAHENIIAPRTAREGDGVTELEMEYASGGTLEKHIKRLARAGGGRVDEGAARTLFRQVVDAVGYLHGEGIAHRDIKMENIVLDADGNARLVDFGAAREGGTEAFLTSMQGTPAYMAPEVALGKAHQGAPADVWSLGVLLYNLVTGGEFPFWGKDMDELRRNITVGQPNRVHVPHHLSAACKGLLGKLLDKSCANRLSIRDVRQNAWLCEGEPPKPTVVAAAAAAAAAAAPPMPPPAAPRRGQPGYGAPAPSLRQQQIASAKIAAAGADAGGAPLMDLAQLQRIASSHVASQAADARGEYVASKAALGPLGSARGAAPQYAAGARPGSAAGGRAGNTPLGSAAFTISGSSAAGATPRGSAAGGPTSRLAGLMGNAGVPGTPARAAGGAPTGAPTGAGMYRPTSAASVGYSRRR